MYYASTMTCVLFCFLKMFEDLDDILISVHMSNEHRSRYQTRIGTFAMNVLSACAPNIEFIYICMCSLIG